jgi:hypothetical protein
MDFHDKYFQERLNSAALRSDMYNRDYNYAIKQMKKVGITGEVVIVDVGCADGEFTRKFSGYAKIFGVEINEKEAAKAFNNGISIIQIGDLKQVKPHVIILRGTLQHITPAEFLTIIDFCPRMLLLLQTPNPESFVYKLLDQSQIALLNPHEDFNGNLNLINLSEIKKLVLERGYRVLGISKPYFMTPYRNPIRDVYHLIVCYFNREKKYIGSWKGNIYRMTIVWDNLND